MHGLLWLIAERVITKILDKALENEKKPYDTKPSDTLLERVRRRINEERYQADSSRHERSDSGVSDRPEQHNQNS